MTCSSVAARSGRVDQCGSEALHPPVQGDVIDLDAALGEEFLEIAVRQSVSEIPANGQHDHLGREPEPGECRQIRWGQRTTSPVFHPDSFADAMMRSINATVPF